MGVTTCIQTVLGVGWSILNDCSTSVKCFSFPFYSTLNCCGFFRLQQCRVDVERVLVDTDLVVCKMVYDKEVRYQLRKMRTNPIRQFEHQLFIHKALWRCMFTQWERPSNKRETEAEGGWKVRFRFRMWAKETLCLGNWDGTVLQKQQGIETALTKGLCDLAERGLQRYNNGLRHCTVKRLWLRFYL